MLNLIEGILKQAKKDYIKGRYISCAKTPEKFVKSEWFTALTMDRIDPQKTLEEWDKEKYIYDLWLDIKTRPIFNQEEAKAISKIFRSTLSTGNISFWDYLSCLEKEGIIQHDPVWQSIREHKDLIQQWGWYRVFKSEDRANSFRPIKVNKGKGYYLYIQCPVYLVKNLSRAIQEKEVE